jgi:hypothetical protein
MLMLREAFSRKWRSIKLRVKSSVPFLIITGEKAEMYLCMRAYTYVCMWLCLDSSVGTATVYGLDDRMIGVQIR